MILTQTPYRISLGGGGTDLPSYYTQFGGFFISAAITKYLYIYANRSDIDPRIHVKYAVNETVDRPEELKHDIARQMLRTLGIENRMEIVSVADIPSGTGLGSSGTYTVGLLLALTQLAHQQIPTKARLAEGAYYIEQLAGHPIGKQDHYIAAFGGLTSFDVAKDGTITVHSLELTSADVQELSTSLLLFYTGMQRSSARILQQQHNDTQRGNTNVIDNLHHIKEIGYLSQDALNTGDFHAFGELLHRHWMMKRQRSIHISDPNLDTIYQIARDNGAIGGKLIGAGGGGFFMFYCEGRSARIRLRRAMFGLGLLEMQYGFDLDGAKVILSK